MFSLANGSPIYVFVREGLVYIPNPELAKILPAISRTAMENIRNSYGITVYQVTRSACIHHLIMMYIVYSVHASCSFAA